MIHSLDTDIADKVGVHAALIFNKILDWCKYHKERNEFFFDGHFWMYNSLSSWAAHFSYMSEKNIRTALDKLVDAGFIIKGNYSESKLNRTNWYALADESPLASSGQSNFPKTANPFAASGKSICPQRPNITIYTRQNNTSTIKEEKKIARAREEIIADIIENNTAWVENQIKAGIEPDDIPALLDFAYDHYVNTKGEEPGRQQLMGDAFYQLRKFKEHRRREGIRARDIEERKRELWKKLLPFIGKEFPRPMVVEFYKFCINLNDGIMYFEQWPEYDLEASLRQHKVKYEQRNKHSAL